MASRSEPVVVSGDRAGDPDVKARERAMAAAYRALGRRDHTEAELRAVLERREVAHEVADWTVEQIRQTGYLDDGEYARRFAEDRRSLDGWGSERIARTLERRGVAPELVAGVVAGRGRDEELAAAAALLARRFPTRLEDERERARAWRVLVTRGYEADLAYEAIREHERVERA